MDHSFNTEIAKAYGVKEAVLIQNLYFWIIKNEANGRHYYEGRNWTYNSLSALEKLFPYFTRKQLRTVIGNCVAKGAVIKGNFNKKGYDKTNWFALSEEVLRVYESCAQTDTGYARMGTAYAQTGTPIPDSKPYSKPDIETRFERFWKAYPKKKAKGDALKAFSKLKADDQLLEIILSALGRQKQSKDWLKEEGKYIPYPATWLSGRRWEDEDGTEEKGRWRELA